MSELMTKEPRGVVLERATQILESALGSAYHLFPQDAPLIIRTLDELDTDHADLAQRFAVELSARYTEARPSLEARLNIGQQYERWAALLRAGLYYVTTKRCLDQVRGMAGPPQRLNQLPMARGADAASPSSPLELRFPVQNNGPANIIMLSQLQPQLPSPLLGEAQQTMALFEERAEHPSLARDEAYLSKKLSFDRQYLLSALESEDSQEAAA